MKTGLIILLVFLGYASANCGCLKCSKHLTVAGKAFPVGNCPPATIIYRNAPNSVSTQTCLPIRVQTPLSQASVLLPTNELKYKVVKSASTCERAPEPVCAKHDAKVEVPLPVPTVTPSVNLRPCVDRVVVPAPRDDCGTQRHVIRKREPACLDNTRENPVYTSYAQIAPMYGYAIRNALFNSILGALRSYSSRGCVFAENPRPLCPISPEYGTATYDNSGSSVNNGWSGNSYPVFPTYPAISPMYQTATYVTSGSSDGYGSSGNSNTRYNNSYPILALFSSTCKGGCRPKREVPFLKHGYKFLINMLPEFVQEPIKNTVNDFALTHPEKILRMVQNKPRELTIKEKLQLYRRKNMSYLKKKLKDHIRYKRDDSSRKDNDFSYHPVKSNYHFDTRSNFMEQSGRHNPYPETELVGLEDEHDFNRVSRRNPGRKLKHLNNTLLLKRLKKQYNTQRIKRSSSPYEKDWYNKYKKRSSPKKHLPLFDSSEIVLPFYHIVEDSSEEEVCLSTPEKYRHRRERDDEDCVGESYGSNYLAGNYKSKERFLRSIIKEELRNYKLRSEREPQDYVLSSSHEKNPHSPIFHIITFPLRLLGHFTDANNQNFPIVGSVPHIIVSTKKYFKDFGKNFKKNILHLTSDIIGDFEGIATDHDIFSPTRHRRNADQNNFSVYGNKDSDNSERARKKRYILKKVDEEEIEEYLMEKLGKIFDDSETSRESYSKSTPSYWTKQHSADDEEEGEKKLVLKKLKPKIILDNNGRPFFEIDGYKRPIIKKTNLNRRKSLRNKDVYKNLRHYDSSEETDSERIASLIDIAKDHVESVHESKYSEMPIQTVKERISQLLFETDTMVHMDFEKYDDVFDQLIALQHMKTSIVQDWKRLIMSKAINDMASKISLLEKFKELQSYKDLTLFNVVHHLWEDNDNIFMAKKLIKILVRLQKLQCIISQVVVNFQNHLHISSESEIEQEIKYVDFLSDLNFAQEKSRNAMISKIGKDRDIALQRNIILVEKLKKLIVYESSSDNLEKEANLLWEMRNIEKMLKTTLDEMKQKLKSGYKVKKELKILFDLLKRYQRCEVDQRKLLSKVSNDGSEEEDSSEEVQMKKKVPKTKIDLEEFKLKVQEEINKRKALLKKKLKKSRKRFQKSSEESDEDD